MKRILSILLIAFCLLSCEKDDKNHLTLDDLIDYMDYDKVAGNKYIANVDSGIISFYFETKDSVLIEERVAANQISGKRQVTNGLEDIRIGAKGKYEQSRNRIYVIYNNRTLTLYSYLNYVKYNDVRYIVM